MKSSAILGCAVAVCLVASAWVARLPAQAPATDPAHAPTIALAAPRAAASAGFLELPLGRVAGPAHDRGSAPGPAPLPPAPERSEPAHRPALAGRVLHADGCAAAGATVVAAGRRALADAQGRFEFDADGADWERGVVALLTDFQPGVAEHVRTRNLQLVLGPAALSIAGRLCDSTGRPIKGWRVSVLDATLLDPLDPAGTTIESACGAGVLRTADDGSFEVRGLCERDYTIAAWRSTRQRIELVASPPTRAGQRGLVLTKPTPGAERSSAIRIVDARGVAVAGLRVGFLGGPTVAGIEGGGTLELAGVLPPHIALVLEGETIAPRVRDTDLCDASTVVLELR